MLVSLAACLLWAVDATGAREAPAAASASPPELPLFTTLRTVDSQRFELALRVSASTRPGARCELTVQAGKQRVRFPKILASEGFASWQWSVPAGAPAGRWTLTNHCRLGRADVKKTLTPIVLVPRARTNAGLVAPGSLAITAGQFVTKPHAQVKGRGAGNGNPGEPGYCTWGAWNLAQWLGASVSGNAGNWARSAEKHGLVVGSKPVVGAVWVRESVSKTDFGHVGVVTKVISETEWESNEMNGGQWVNVEAGTTTEFNRYVIHPQQKADNIRFIYKPNTQPGRWINEIVQWDADPKPQKTAWLVGADGKRRWIPDIPTYDCLKARGIPGPTRLQAAVLDQYPDLTGVWVTCSSGGIGAGSGPYPPPQPDPTPAPPPPSNSTDKSAPSAPSGLATPAITQTSIRLTWTASSDNVAVTGYDIYLNDTFVTTITALAADYTGRTCGTTYTLGVSARDAAGNVSPRTSINTKTTDCPTPPPPTPTVTLAKGPTAPAGYRYAISLNNYAPNTAISITCYDTASPGGFYTFTLTTNNTGAASTASYCYSGDHGDHWVKAAGIESNRVNW